MADMIMAGTGHRPNKLGGYGQATAERLFALACAALDKYQPVRVISGMALGWDQALARAAIARQIPFTAAVPFVGQEGKWPAASQQEYRGLLSCADKIEIVCGGGYSAASMQIRNIWMVDNATHLLALWDGSSGGTGNCVRYAQTAQIQIINLWDSWEKHHGL